jgi:hypothetical protein
MSGTHKRSPKPHAILMKVGERMLNDKDEPLIRLKLEGNQFDEEYNLFYLTHGLINIQRVLDKSYLAIAGKKKMAERDREIFVVKSSAFQKGSFVADLSMYIMISTQLSLVPYNSLTSTNIWNLAKHGFEYLRTVLEYSSKGEKMRLEGDGNMFNVVGNNNQVIIQVHPKALTFLEKAEHNFEELANMVDVEKGVNSVAITNLCNNEDGIKIGIKEKELFESKSELESQAITFIGKIIKINGIEYTGKLLVIKSDDEDLEINREYNFDFISKTEDHLVELREGFMADKIIEALKETSIETTTLKKGVKRFMIIKIH